MMLTVGNHSKLKYTDPPLDTLHPEPVALSVFASGWGAPNSIQSDKLHPGPSQTAHVTAAPVCAGLLA